MGMGSSLTAIVLDGKFEAFSTKTLADNYRGTAQKPDTQFEVDLDFEKGRKASEDKPNRNKHRVAIKFAKKIRLEVVRAYLDGKTDFDNSVLEGISKPLSVLTFENARLTLFRLS